MSVLPKIVDRYIVREFLITLAGVLGVCAVLLLIAKVFEDFDDMLDSPISFADAVKYFLLTLPFRLLEVVPLATVLAVIFSIGTLARNREMLAITAGGQSPYRSAAPVLFSVLLMTFLILFLNETAIPYCQERAEFYRQVFVKGESELSLARRRHIFDKGIGRTFFLMEEFDAKRNRMYEVLIFEESENPAFWRYSLLAASAQLVRENVEPDRDLWVFERAVEHYYDSRGRPTSATVHTEPVERLLEADLDQYLQNRKEAPEMNLRELGRYIHTLRIRGEDVSAYVTDWYAKLLFPFAPFALGMIAFALAMRAHIASLPMAFGKGIFLTMLFYGIAALGQTLGHIGVAPPLLAALGPVGLFMIIGVRMLRRSGFAM